MWELISQNRRKSFVLFILMGLCLAAMGYAFGYYYALEDGGIFGLVTAIGVWLILSSLAYFSGDSILLSSSGAKEVKRETRPQLYNVVEEMKIAANLPSMPKIYIIDEEAMNAFAVGRSPDKSSIAVTAGLLARLNRDELQGVIAHEMSHIINRDSLYMTFAGVTLGVITLLSNIFWWSGRSGGMSYRYRSRSSSGSGNAIILIASLIFIILGAVLARLLYFAISRRREYLADASAVRLTRYPEGLASALDKISVSGIPLTVANKVTAPLYIANPLKAEGVEKTDWESTHPPISERIRILRSMASGAGYLNYQDAFNRIRGKKTSLLPQSALKEKAYVPIRVLAQAGGTADPKSTRRALGDLLMTVNDYFFITCACGLKLKVPPTFADTAITCPRCGHQYPLGARKPAQ